ncbi:unnamed protein product [Clonostachys rosea]|uniref:SMP-30/Gluconolactonase/LRE-like region domain-containing protein n=1 Tax=Bionectria ochroleuca TaxID=29856 RepID=A0ABY6TQ27_BIOOC|nr:unnamed protein product [Clonostachys rosea]
MATSSDERPANRAGIPTGSVNGPIKNHVLEENIEQHPKPQSNPDPTVKSGLQEIILIDELPRDTWPMATAIRPNGDVLLPRLNGPELYSTQHPRIHSNRSPSSEPRLIHSFSDATSVFNICRLKNARREEYAVLTAIVDLETPEIYNTTVWRVVPSAEGAAEEIKPEVTKIADIPEAQFCIGMTSASERILLVADSGAGCIYRIDVETGMLSICHEDASMRPATRRDALGIARIRILGDYLFYTNASRGTFCRLPIRWTGDGQDLWPAGACETVASGLANADGMVITRDGAAAYIDSYITGTLWKVEIDCETGSGVVHVLRERIPDPTGMELVYAEQNEEPTLFVVCCGCLSQDWRDRVGAKWLNMLHVDRSIKVTVEIFITYEPNPDYVLGTCEN